MIYTNGGTKKNRWRNGELVRRAIAQVQGKECNVEILSADYSSAEMIDK